MKMLRGGKRLWCAAIGLGMALVAGCQTWPPEIGMTLPSPSYLKHPPQYTPPSPPFPLTRELASLEEAAAQQNARALPVIP